MRNRERNWVGRRRRERGLHNPKESSSPPSSTLPQLLFLRGQSRVISQKQAHPRSLSITNLSKHKSTRSPRSYETLCLMELDGFHTESVCEE